MPVISTASVYGDALKNVLNLPLSERQLADVIDKDNLRDTVNTIVSLKKRDRIQYLCNMFKAYILHRAVMKGMDVEESEKGKAALKKYNAKFYFGAHAKTLATFTEILSDLQHFYSLNLPKIDNYVFDVATGIEPIIQHMYTAEDEWKKTIAEKGIEAYGVPFIKFPNGSVWWDLQREVCKIEGDTMGHCGNAGDPKDGDTILSYRVPVKGGLWKPLLTFILRKNHFLGEMKGRGNDKPLQKFHPYILALLEDSRIKGIEGGGYLPENNFSIFDLSDAKAEALLKTKPTLATPMEYYGAYVRTDNKLYVQNLIKVINGRGQKAMFINGSLMLRTAKFTSMADIAHNLKQPALGLKSKDDIQNYCFSEGALYDSYASIRNTVLEKIGLDDYERLTNLLPGLSFENSEVLDRSSRGYAASIKKLLDEAILFGGWEQLVLDAFEDAVIKFQRDCGINNKYEMWSNFTILNKVKPNDRVALFNGALPLFNLLVREYSLESALTTLGLENVSINITVDSIDYDAAISYVSEHVKEL